MAKDLQLKRDTDSLRGIGPSFATFTIIYQHQPFSVIPVLAGSLSWKLACLFQSDPLCTEFSYKTTLSGNFDPVCKYLNCQPFNVTPATAPFLVGVAAELQMATLATAAISALPEEAVRANNFHILRLLYENGGNCDQLVSVIASHFEKLDQKELQSLPISLLDCLLKSPSLLIQDKQTLVNFLRGIFDWGALPNHRLAKFLPFAVMDDVEVAKILGNPKLNMNTMKYALLRADPQKALKSGSSA
jgi:hypothetical protein